MNKFYVITNQSKDESLTMTYRIKEFIKKNGGQCILEAEQGQICHDIECIIVLGGDGTLMRAAREWHSWNIPFFGINMGTLGYLTEAEVANVEESLSALMSGPVYTEERMMLRGVLNGKTEDIALNDIVVTRFGAPHLIRMNIYVNGEFLNTYHADGVIVSTPTGSTAYNLSAGGPILEPTASMIVITPICSHALNTSSIVLSADDEITIEIGNERQDRIDQIGISFDGENNVEVHAGDKIVISKASAKPKLLKLNKVSFLEILRRKMKGN